MHFKTKHTKVAHFSCIFIDYERVEVNKMIDAVLSLFLDLAELVGRTSEMNICYILVGL